MEKLRRLYDKEFIEPPLVLKDTSPVFPDGTGYSREDKRFMDIMNKGSYIENGHFCVPLPFREPNVMLPNNFNQAYKRVMYLRKRFDKDKKFHKDYTKLNIG